MFYNPLIQRVRSIRRIIRKIMISDLIRRKIIKRFKKGDIDLISSRFKTIL